MSNTPRPLRPTLPGRLLTAVLVILLVFQSGCATLRENAPETNRQATLGRVAVVAATQEPEIDFSLLLKGKGSGAAAGAGRTFLGCLSGLSHGSCSGEFCGVAAVFLLGVCGAAGVMGGVAGAVAAPGAAEVAATEDVFLAALDVETVQVSLRQQVEKNAAARGEAPVSGLTDRAQAASAQGDYRVLAEAGIDTVLEVALSKAGMRSWGIDKYAQLQMQATVRAVRTRDNTEIFSTTYMHDGLIAALPEWLADDGALLLRQLRMGYEALGTHIHDHVFLLHPFPDRKPHMGGTLSVSFGLAPIDPPTRGQLSGDDFIGQWFEWTAVDNAQPLLRWQRFPRATDSEAAPEAMRRATQIRYDLVIARERNLAPDEIVYRRTGLTETAHRVESALNRGTRYFWTVRASFVIDGQPRVTEWGSTSYAGGEHMTAPSRWSYRFRIR